MAFPKQEYCSGLLFSFLFQVIFVIEPMFPALAGRFFTSEPPGKQQQNFWAPWNWGSHIITVSTKWMMTEWWWLTKRICVKRAHRHSGIANTRLSAEGTLKSRGAGNCGLEKKNNNTGLLSSLVYLLSSKKNTVRGSLIKFYGDFKIGCVRQVAIINPLIKITIVKITS